MIYALDATIMNKNTVNVLLKMECGCELCVSFEENTIERRREKAVLKVKAKEDSGYRWKEAKEESGRH